MSRFGKRLILVLLVAQATTVAADWRQEQAVMDSLSHVHPRMRTRWLSEHGIDARTMFEPKKLDSTGLRMVGKWGRGPSYEVTGQDSLVFLSLGSEVAIINFADPDSPLVISEVQASGLAVQSAVRDSFLYIGVSTGAAGLEVWNIENLSAPVFRGRALTRLTDFCIKDTFAYVTSRRSSPSRDTFKVYNLSDPANPRLVGFCPDSGHTVTVSGNTVIQADWHDLHAIDVSDPANPHRVGAYPGYAVSVAARNTVCCAAFELSQSPPDDRFAVLDISDPASIYQLGSLDNAGAYDIYLTDTLAFLSGFESDFPFRVVSIADSTRPRSIGSNASLTQSYAVWANSDRVFALVANAGYGLAVFDLANPASPRLTSQVLAAASASDVCVDGHYAYVASYEAGLHILDVLNPASVVTVGSYDTAGVRPAAEAVIAKDSFAFMPWFSARMFRSVDVTDKANPKFAGECDGPGPAKAMVLRDSLVYQASNTRFAVYNVARPRQPVLVGSCVDADYAWDMDMKGDLASVAHILSLRLIDVARPDSPRVVGSWTGYVNCVDIVDTIAYAAGPYTGLVALSVANPAAPYVLDSLHMTDTLWWNDVVVVDSLAYVGGERMWGVDVSDPQNLRLVPGVSWTPPYLVRRLVYAAPYLYAACCEAGVCILETVQVGISEPQTELKRPDPRLQAYPSITRGPVRLPWLGRHSNLVSVRDVAGREVSIIGCQQSDGCIRVDLSLLPSGFYFIELQIEGQKQMTRIIKQ